MPPLRKRLVHGSCGLLKFDLYLYSQAIARSSGASSGLTADIVLHKRVLARSWVPNYYSVVSMNLNTGQAAPQPWQHKRLHVGYRALYHPHQGPYVLPLTNTLIIWVLIRFGGSNKEFWKLQVIDTVQPYQGLLQNIPTLCPARVITWTGPTSGYLGPHQDSKSQTSYA